MSDAPIPTDAERALAKAQRGLKLVSANLPHLAGLAHTVRLRAAPSCAVAAIGASGLLLFNPKVFLAAPVPEVVFVLAHELLHLALDTFGRQGTADPFVVNVAHDYIINDILSNELGMEVPLQGLVRPGARSESLEKLVTEIGQRGAGGRACWGGGSAPNSRGRQRAGKSKMQEELEKAGLLPGAQPEGEHPPGDVLTAEQEAELEPEINSAQRRKLKAKIQREAERALNVQELSRQMKETDPSSALGQGGIDAPGTAYLDAILSSYTPPWQLALQHWLDAVAPGPRTYARPSRRGEGSEVLLPGRKREGWTLHVVLDTSGSMVDELPTLLGLLATFAESAGVEMVHVLQCDVGVTADEWLEPSQLQHYRVAGFGGSDMSPAMNKLGEDPDVAAVLVLTDGCIEYPREEPNYAVLWALTSGEYFLPPYGTIVPIRS